MITSIKSTIALAALLIAGNSANAQCANAANIYSFTYNGVTYEVVKENKTWIDAAACAVERGGHLTEINDQAEQDAVYSEVLNNAGIAASNTVAPDGGGASYVWIGGNDLATEGDWVWDGANAGTGPQFWQGTSSGNQIGGLFNNWGNEPDDFGQGQDGLGLAITDWPLGVSGQWNDVNDQNSLYFVIEYPNTTGVIGPCFEFYELSIFPNPVQNELNVMNDSDGEPFSQFTIIDAFGKTVKSVKVDDSPFQVIDVAELRQGIYYIKLLFTDGTLVSRKFVK